MQVHLEALFGWIDSGLLVLAMALAGYLLYLMRAFLAAHAKFLDQQTRTQLLAAANQALSEGIAFALNALHEKELQHSAVTFPTGTKGWIAAAAAQYAADHAGPEIDKLGWGADQIAAKVMAKLPPVSMVEDTTGVKITSAPLQVSPLPHAT